MLNTRHVRPLAGLRRQIAPLLIACLTTGLAVTAQQATHIRPAFAMCSGNTCDLGPPYDSGCANSRSAVESRSGPSIDGQGTYVGNYVVTLMWSPACVANWGEITFPVGCCLAFISVESKSPADNNNGREVAAQDGWGDTFMVDGRYQARTCGAATYDPSDQGRCTGWH